LIDVTNKTKDEVFIHISVKDTGIGISRENQENMFKRFTQFEDKENPMAKGTGLGLAIVSRLVQLMGGEIRCESELGIGSEFSFDIKLKYDSNVSYESVKVVPHTFELSAKQIKVLVAEDDLVNQIVIKKYLEKSNIHVTVVNNGEEAVEIVKVKKFDMVFMDVNMPKLNGHEATRMIRQFYNDKLPIIAMTANVMGKDKQLCLEAGMNDYISKPIEFEMLDKLIRTHYTV